MNVKVVLEAGVDPSMCPMCMYYSLSYLEALEVASPWKREGVHRSQGHQITVTWKTSVAKPRVFNSVGQTNSFFPT